uniref:N(6)-L-threonylcarbamoyladenine synthase n=1 Tax=Rhodosorus marinus TaxID=101924 RepID=A0A7S3A801_9RHOD|mmetsp:Transcript_6677/g.28469  ORF Transcript_6677/g.28469 Transcript_6677/m.28469 type:complete len:425 (+) Transcript_6677:1866-3140(+)
MSWLSIGFLWIIGAKPGVRRRERLRAACTDGGAVESVRQRRRRRVGVPKGVGHQNADWCASLVKGSYAPGSGALAGKKDLVVLGIETSCDDTAAAVVRADGTVLGDSVVSQHEIHQQWGGVVPNLAKEAHAAAIDGVVGKALQKAEMNPEHVDAVAVTTGPGLEICLRIGFDAAKEFCETHEKPFVAVNHLEGHCVLARMLHRDLEYPFLVVLVSGGHCQILVAEGQGIYALLGGTLDDAIGEAYDKTARLLGLNVGGGGGPALEQLALNGDENAYDLPMPMRDKKNCNLSYAGLKNAVRLIAETDAGRRSEDIAASFQRVAIEHLIQKLRTAMNWCEERQPGRVKTMVVCGGVAANRRLRSKLTDVCSDFEWKLVVPPPRLCTDNGAMIAWAGIERIQRGILDDPRLLEVVSRWPLSTRLIFD